jgi:hypothetical protein
MKPENMNAIIVDISSLIQTSPEGLEISDGVPWAAESQELRTKLVGN